MPIGVAGKWTYSCVCLGALAAAAFLQARGVGALVGATLAPSASQLAAIPDGPQRSPAEAPHVRAASARAILENNPFDSVTRALVAHADASAPPRDPNDIPTCKGVRVVLIAAVADDDGSVAAILVSSESKPVLRRRGQAIAGKTVAFIARDRVWLEAPDASLCLAEMFGVTAREVTL